ncbi:endonuclease IV APN [Besnoitia besnoiti]|uniref:Endonuclease IV APN n=1 Tax=Besnoitia besnoiti TaxID=94643 RepID=A0A2A9M917_BESBE|nr:endonuclease IV APN [Besnoitia besnoiti]PFH32183.1 endonuclease IV APN [Besnoitia besnoiti]
MKRDKLDFADKLAEKAQATSPPVNSASPRSPGVRGKQALPRQVKQGSGTTAKEEKITTKAAGDGSDDGHGAATVKAEKPEDGATIASPAGTTNAPRKGKRSKDECDETQEGEAGKDDGEVKTEAKPAKHAAGKKGHAAQNAVPDEPDEVFLKHRALAESSRKFLGAHISAAGGVQNAPLNCLAVGGQAFAFFLKNQRRWDSPPISDESADEFKASVARLKLDGPMHILPHGSYLINLANPDSAKRKVSYNAFLDDLKRCEQVGVHRYVFHPGSTVGNCTKEESIQHVAECLNKAIAATKSVTILVENMAGQKNVLCSQFEDLRDIISLIDNKDRIGVCLDTCHLYSAGHDIRTEESFEAVMKKFDSIVGMSYLKGMHINDSKAPIASGLDRHEHLGKGTLGMAPFKFIMQHPTWFKDMPLILETPEVDNNGPKQWRRETQMMYSFIED